MHVHPGQEKHGSTYVLTHTQIIVSTEDLAFFRRSLRMGAYLVVVTAWTVLPFLAQTWIIWDPIVRRCLLYSNRLTCRHGSYVQPTYFLCKYPFIAQDGVPLELKPDVTFLQEPAAQLPHPGLVSACVVKVGLSVNRPR